MAIVMEQWSGKTLRVSQGDENGAGFRNAGLNILVKQPALELLFPSFHCLPN